MTTQFTVPLLSDPDRKKIRDTRDRHFFIKLDSELTHKDMYGTS
jgi:hypothetical protein